MQRHAVKLELRSHDEFCDQTVCWVRVPSRAIFEPPPENPLADPGGVQGVQTLALLFRCPFLKRIYFENMSLVVTVFSRTGCFVNTRQELYELSKGSDIALDVVRQPGANYFF